MTDLDPAIENALDHLDGADPTELALTITLDLDTITHNWAGTDMATRSAGNGGASTTSSRLPGPTIELRADTTLTLAFWAHALVDEWPSVVQHLERDDDDSPYRVVTENVDLTDIHATAATLRREAARLAQWDRHGTRCAAELHVLARQIRAVVSPPKRDTVTIGDCPTCDKPVKVRTLARVPVPTTDPSALAEWATVPTTNPGAWDSVSITHPCGVDLTLAGWHRAITGHTAPVTADVVITQLHARLGVRYSPVTVRTWANRGLINTRGYSTAGHARYDLTEVLAHVVTSEALRDAPMEVHG